jgi:hypothetical protein
MLTYFITGQRIQAALEVHLLIGELFVGLFSGSYCEEVVGSILSTWEPWIEV